MFDKKQLKVLTGCCLAAFAFLALICLVMHFSFAGLMIFIGAALMTIGAFTESLQMLLPCGFAVSVLAYVVEFVWYLIQSFSRGFNAFYLLFPILECLLMVLIFLGMLKIAVSPDQSRTWGIGLSGAAFATMLLVVGTAFAHHFTGAGEANYFVFLQRLALIPAGFLFGSWMEGQEPLMTIDLQRDEGGETGQTIGYVPETDEYGDPEETTEETPEDGTVFRRRRAAQEVNEAADAEIPEEPEE